MRKAFCPKNTQHRRVTAQDLLPLMNTLSTLIESHHCGFNASYSLNPNALHPEEHFVCLKHRKDI